MTVSDWIALVALLVGGGGGTVAVSKGTRLIVAVEGLVKAFQAVREDIKEIVTTNQDHATRLARAEGVLQALSAQQPPKA